jgi:hypothetical protein
MGDPLIHVSPMAWRMPKREVIHMPDTARQL